MGGALLLEDAQRTRVELEHRELDRHGEHWDGLREGVAGDEGRCTCGGTLTGSRRAEGGDAHRLPSAQRCRLGVDARGTESRRGGLVSPVEVRDLGEPEAVVTGPLGESFQVRLAGTVVTRHVLQPGWSWEAHAQPEVGTASCELYHRVWCSRGGWASGRTRARRWSSGPTRCSTCHPATRHLGGG